MSPALAGGLFWGGGRFLTTGPPGKSPHAVIFILAFIIIYEEHKWSIVVTPIEKPETEHAQGHTATEWQNWDGICIRAGSSALPLFTTQG